MVAVRSSIRIVLMNGRTLAKIDAIAKDIAAAGGIAEAAQVDPLDDIDSSRFQDPIADVPFDRITTNAATAAAITI